MAPQNLSSYRNASNHSKMAQSIMKRNEYETELLKRYTKQLYNEQMLERILQKHEKIELKKHLIQIPKVKRCAPLSPERILFLNKYGITLSDSEKSYDINYFISLIDHINDPSKEKSSSTGYINDAWPKNPSKFPLRLDFTKRDIKECVENQAIGNTDDGQVTFNNILEKNKDTNGNSSDHKVESRTTDQKVNCKSLFTPGNTRPSWMFRTIEPPEFGRFMWNNTKFGAKREEAKKKSVIPESNVKKRVAESNEDVALNEKANDYRYTLLSRHKMTSLFTHSPANGSKKTNDNQSINIINVNTLEPPVNINE